MELLNRFRGADRGLLLILLASLLVQGFVLAAVHDMPCRGDACRYIHCARSLVEGRGWEYGGDESWDAGHTPPLYVLFVAAHLVLFQGRIWPSMLTQSLLVLAMAVLAYKVARAAWGRRAGLWAAGLVGIYPSLIAFAHYNFSEVLYSFLLLLALSQIWTAKRGTRERELRTLAVAGMAFGLATLTREVTWYLAPLVAAWVAAARPWDIRRAGLRFAAVVAPVVLLVAPWTAVNAFRFGGFLLLSTNAGNVLYRNQNTGPPENYDFRSHKVRPKSYPERPRPRCRLKDPVENYRCEIANALEYTGAHPGRVVARAIPKLQALVNPSSFPVRYLRQKRYGPVGNGTVKAVTILTAGSFLAVVLLAVGALWLSPPGPERSLTATVIVFFLIVFAVTFGMSRYRLSLMPLLAIQAASVLADPTDLAAGARSSFRWIGLLATLAFLARAWMLYLPLISDVF